MSDLEPLPNDIRSLLDAADAGAPPPPTGIEQQVLAKVSASTVLSTTTATLAATIVKPLAAIVLAVTIGGGALIATKDQRRAADVALPPPPAPTQMAVVEKWKPAPVVPDAPAVVVEKPSQPKSEDDNAAESVLLEHARDALSRGDGDVALKVLLEHSQRFPKGQLVEERHALTVVAYAARGDMERARAAARAFLREHPQSIFSETVRAAASQ
jgi:hypothetical protein